MTAFLGDYPVALLFLVVGIGYLVGKIRFVGFDLGPVTGVLFTGLFFGNYGLALNPTIQTMGFVLFIFSVGLQAGPRFFSVLRTDGLRYLALSVVIGVTGFTLAILLARAMGFELGAAAGMLAGAMTSSPTLAAAQEAIRTGQVPLPDGTTADQVMTSVTTAYAITYIFGMVGLILIIRLLPKLAGVDFKAEAARLASEQSGGVEDSATGLPDVTVRTYRLIESEYIGIPLRELYERSKGLAAISYLRRDGELIEITPETIVRVGDEVAVVGYVHRLLEAGGKIGEEIHVPELLANPIESCRIVVTRTRAKNLDLGVADIREHYACFVAKIERIGVTLPATARTRLQAGDVLHTTGHRASLDRLGSALGHVERAIDETDLVTFGVGIAAGTFLGSLSIAVGGVSVGFGSAGGLLAAGLTIGYLRALHPTFGRVPSAARWVFMELGLLAFMAGVGLRAGSGILDALAASGPTLFVAGTLVTSIPVLAGFVFGRFVLKIHPVLLLGAITGSMTSSPALGIVNREAGNSLPALGYTGAYAFANVLLTVAGSLILLL